MALVQFEPLRRPAKRVGPAIGLGIGYGVLTTVALAVLVMPIWLSTLGFPGEPPFPNVATPGALVSLLGHIAFDVPVALAYALIARD